MEKNQKILYEHFKKVSVEGKDDLIRARAKANAAEILKSYPGFEKKEVKTDSKKEEVKEKK